MYQYSNSLIRQFPSSVTGNAAVGVQATIYVGETNTLAQLFEVSGAAKSNPVTTDAKGFYSFSLADGDYRIVFSSSQFSTLRISVLDGAQIREDFDDLVASNTAFRNEQQAAYDSFVLSQGWDQVGTFAVGFEFNSPNQVGQDDDGNWWRSIVIPKTVAPATDPTSDSDYKLVGDGVLRSDLAANDSSVLIGGVEPSKLRKLVTVAELAAKAFPIGSLLTVTDRDNATFEVISSATVNGFGILPVGGGKFAMLRLHSSDVNVKWLGAKGDGVTDDSAAIQHALDYYYSVYLPKGNYLHSSSLFGRAAQKVYSDYSNNQSAAATAFLIYTGIGTALSVAAAPSNFFYGNYLENVTLVASGAAINTATGLLLKNLSETRVFGINSIGFAKGIVFDNVNICECDYLITSNCPVGLEFSGFTSAHVELRNINIWNCAIAAVDIRASLNQVYFKQPWLENFLYGFRVFVASGGGQLGLRLFIENPYVSTDDIGDFPNSIPFYIDLQDGTGELFSEQVEIKGGLLRSVDTGTDPSVIAINGTAGSSTIKSFCLDNLILSGGKGSGISSTLPDVNWELRGHIVSTSTFNGSAVPLFNSAPKKLIDYRDTAASDYTCLWGGSTGNPSIGNGSLVAKTKRVGNIDHVSISMTAGSTTTFGSGTWSFTSPRVALFTSVGALYALDAGTTQMIGVCKIEAGTNIIQMHTDGTTDFNSTYPFIWAENDRLALSIQVFS